MVRKVEKIMKTAKKGAILKLVSIPLAINSRHLYIYIYISNTG